VGVDVAVIIVPKVVGLRQKGSAPPVVIISLNRQAWQPEFASKAIVNTLV